MAKFLIFTLACVATVVAHPVVEDAQGGRYFLVPIHRARRDTNVAISDGRPGTIISASHQGTIFNSNGHHLDGAVSASTQFRPSGPTSVGGQLGYSHVPSGSNLNIAAQHTGHYGTDVRATGTANLWSGGNHQINAVGSYDRHFGGFGGTGQPNYYAGLEYKMKYGY